MLSLNPYYKLTPEEEARLSDFLYKRQESDTIPLPEKSSKKLKSKRGVAVRNVVQKAPTSYGDIDEA